MPLPDDKTTAWPPADWKPLAQRIGINAAWYSGDEEALSKLYGCAPGSTRPSEKGNSLINTATRWFWGTRSTDANAPRQRLHAPAAADVAATSADLLFGEPPTFQIPEAHGEKPDPDAVKAEARLLQIIEDDGFETTLLEAAEIAAGLSGVYLRPVWDKDLADHPMLTAVHADHAIPEFAFGRLRAVTFHRIVRRDGAGAVWRHLERYELGKILHGLYIGRDDTLGARVNLKEHPDTALLAAADTDNGEMPVPGVEDDLAVRYIPNVRPNRTFRHLPVGRADTEGTETFQDALDETYTNWMREVRLVKPRIVVPYDFLQNKGRGLGAGFDVDQEVFSPLDIDPKSAEKAGITITEFMLHTEEYAKTCAELFERIVVTGGFSPSTFGLIGDTSENQTATEVRQRSGRTDATIARKQRYWQAGVADILEISLRIDSAVFGGDLKPFRARMDFAPQETDARKIAETIGLLRQAYAVSIQTAVTMAQPELEGDELKGEVQRIMDETGVSLEDPTRIPGQQEQEEQGAEEPVT